MLSGVGLGSQGSSQIMSEMGLSLDALGLNLKGRPPQATAGGSTILTKTYAFELFPTGATAGAAGGAGSESRMFFFGMNPTMLRSTDFSSGATTFTAGGLLLEGGKTFLRQYTLSGRSGSLIRRGYSSGEAPIASGAGFPTRMTSDGHRLFRELHKFFKVYSDLKEEVTAGHGWVMAFHDFVNEDAFIINPRQFEVSRKGGQGDYSFNIQFDGVAERIGYERGLLENIGYISQRAGDVVSSTILNAGGIMQDVADTTHEFFGILTTTVDRVTAAWSALEENYGAFKSIGDTLETDIDALNSRFDRKDRTSASNEGVNETLSLSDKAEIVHQEKQAQLAENTVNSGDIDVAMSRLFESYGVNAPLNQNTSHNPLSSTEILKLKRNASLLLASFFAELVSAQREGSSPVADTGNRVGTTAADVFLARGRRSFSGYESLPVTEVSVLRGDTLHSLSLRYLGNRRGGEYIARINNLKFPHISDSGEPNTVRFGDKIKVPTLENTRVLAHRSRVDDSIYGTDFRLTQEGNFVISGDKKDFALIEGLGNLKQALETIKLRTKLRTNPLFPDVGIADMIGETSAADNIISVFTAAREAILHDPRVLFCRARSVVDEGDGVVVLLEADAARTSDSLSIGAPVRNVTL